MIYSREDGTYVITHNGFPYHVIDTDPIYQEVLERIDEGEEVQPEHIPTEKEKEEEQYNINSDWYKYEINKRIDTIREKKTFSGFPFNNRTIQADPVSVTNANGFMSAVLAGIAIYPIRWITKENDFIEFNNADEFKNMVIAMLAFVQEKFYEARLAKDEIINATDFETIYNIYINYKE